MNDYLHVRVHACIFVVVNETCLYDLHCFDIDDDKLAKFLCDVDDDDWLVKFVHYNRWWLDDYYCSYLKEKKKIFARHRCSSAMLVLCCFWSIEVHSNSASQTRLLYLIMDNSPGWAGFSYNVPVMMNQLWYTDCDNSANYLSIIIVLFIYFRSIGHGLIVLESRFYSLVLFFIYTRWYHFKNYYQLYCFYHIVFHPGWSSWRWFLVW